MLTEIGFTKFAFITLGIYLTFCKAAHSQITNATLILCKADLEFRWNRSNWPRDSAGLISWFTIFTPGSQIQQQSAPNNLKERKRPYYKNYLRENFSY